MRALATSDRAVESSQDDLAAPHEVSLEVLTSEESWLVILDHASSTCLRFALRERKRLDSVSHP